MPEHDIAELTETASSLSKKRTRAEETSSTAAASLTSIADEPGSKLPRTELTESSADTWTTLSLREAFNTIAIMSKRAGFEPPPSYEAAKQASEHGDYANALELLKTNGNLLSKLALGVMYYNGYGCDRDVDRAIDYLEGFIGGLEDDIEVNNRKLTTFHEHNMDIAEALMRLIDFEREKGKLTVANAQQFTDFYLEEIWPYLDFDLDSEAEQPPIPLAEGLYDEERYGDLAEMLNILAIAYAKGFIVPLNLELAIKLHSIICHLPNFNNEHQTVESLSKLAFDSDKIINLSAFECLLTKQKLDLNKARTYYLQLVELAKQQPKAKDLLEHVFFQSMRQQLEIENLRMNLEQDYLAVKYSDLWVGFPIALRSPYANPDLSAAKIAIEQDSKEANTTYHYLGIIFSSKPYPEKTAVGKIPKAFVTIPVSMSELTQPSYSADKPGIIDFRIVQAITGKDWNTLKNSFLDRIRRGKQYSENYETSRQQNVSHLSFFKNWHVNDQEFKAAQHKHSEQHMYELFDKINPELLVQKWQAQDPRLVTGCKIYAIVSDLFSDRSSCPNCKTATIAVQNDSMPNTFLNNLERYLFGIAQESSASQTPRFFSSKKPPQNTTRLRMVTRITAAQPDFTHKSGLVHENPTERDIKKLENMGIFEELQQSPDIARSGQSWAPGLRS